MRAVACAGVALLVGCSGGVEERLTPIPLRGRLNLPSAAARAGVVDRTWSDADGERFHVQTGERTMVSVRKEIPFLSDAAVASLRGARIALEVQRLDLGMAATIDATLVLDGVRLTGGRVEVPAQAISTELEVGVDASCPFEHAEDLPNGVELDVLLQPLVIHEEAP